MAEYGAVRLRNENGVVVGLFQDFNSLDLYMIDQGMDLIWSHGNGVFVGNNQRFTYEFVND